jgi:molecular chaperone HtpG
VSPYRAEPDTPVGGRGGVVDEIVRQFADRYAFVRELVQNAVDAGAKRVRVVIDDAGPSLVVRVEDDGAGMTLEIIEGPLLTLFSSSKEGLKGKIGRYGVGFMSVFALEPEHVLVETWRKEGSYTVRIGHSHDFEVREAAKRPGSGTHVSLVLAPGKEDRNEVAARVLSAARRWCRHLARPVSVVTVDGEQRVNEKLALRAPAVVEETADGVHAIVGIAAGTHLMPGEPGHEGTGTFAGFYAHGLTLLETTEPPTAIPGVRFKVACADLAHTISRDDVRRDAAFERAMRVVRRLVRRELRTQVANEQLRAAHAAARAPAAFAEAAPIFFAASATLPPADVEVPLVEPIGDRPGITLARARKLAAADKLFAATGPGPLTTAVAERGGVVLRIEPGTTPSSSAMCAAFELSGLPRPSDRLALLLAREPSTKEARLAERVTTILRALGQPVAEVLVGDVADGAVDRSALFLPPCRAGRWVLPLEGRRRGEPTLVLIGAHPAVRRATEIAAGRRGPSMLSRLVLLEEHGALSPERADALLAAAMELP